MALIASVSAGAQGVKIYLKGYSNPIDYPASTIDRIEFYPSENNPDNPDNPDNPNIPGDTSDKKYLEETGVELLNQIKANDFNGIVKSVESLDDIDEGDLDAWGEECLNAAKTVLSGTYSKTDRHGYTYYVTDYKYLIKASGFTGHFKAQGGRWVKESNANDLQFTFTDNNGKTCVARIATSGSTKTIHVGDFENYDRYRNGYEYYENQKTYIDVPQHIDATYSINGTTRVQVTADIDVSTLGEEWDLASQGASVKVTAVVNKENGGKYSVNINRAGYQAGTGAFVEFSISNDNKVIISGKAAAAGTLNINVRNTTEEPDVRPEDFGAADANIDILGRVQLKTTINSIGNFFTYLEDANDNSENKNEHRRLVGRANSELNAAFYYNNGTDKRGTLELESFEKDSWGSRYYYDTRLIIKFTSDNSSYDIGSYFNEDAFQTVIDAYKNLLDDFERLTKRSARQ